MKKKLLRSGSFESFLCKFQKLRIIYWTSFFLDARRFLPFKLATVVTFKICAKTTLSIKVVYKK